MNLVNGKAAMTMAAACVATMLVVVPSAQGAVTISSVTTPTDGQYLLYNNDTPNTFAISGTTNGTATDYVDLVCYAGDKYQVVATNVAVNSNGTFTVPAKVHNALLYRICKLRAVPAGTKPAELSGYIGPRLFVGITQTYHVTSGLNTGKLYDFYLYFQQVAGGMDYDSLGGCGVDDGYLLDNTDSLTTITWYCNAWLANSDGGANPTRSAVRVDGVDAYPTAGAKQINQTAASGFPSVSSYSYSQNAKTGNGAIHEAESFVKCPTATFPPTNATCPSFNPTGVTDTRTITQDHGGQVAWVTDVFTSTNGKAHTVDLLWQNNQRFNGYGDGNGTQVEYEFPGQSSYSMHALGAAVSLPDRPGTIFVRYHGAADGDPYHGRGAIVYGQPATTAKFIYFDSRQSDFTLHQTIKVPAHGSTTLRFAYISDFQQATVNALAKQATPIVDGCTVPNVVGTGLAAAKTAITKAHCTVGKISYAASSTVASGHVISESPKAGTNVDYRSKVALVVSK